MKIVRLNDVETRKPSMYPTITNRIPFGGATEEPQQVKLNEDGDKQAPKPEIKFHANIPTMDGKGRMLDILA